MLKGLKPRLNLPGLTAGHLALAALAANARGAGLPEYEGRDRLNGLEHLCGHLANLPLRALAAAKVEEMQQLPRVHRDDDLWAGRVRREVSRVLGRYALGHELVIEAVELPYLLLEPAQFAFVSRYRMGDDVLRACRLYIPLALLGK